MKTRIAISAHAAERYLERHAKDGTTLAEATAVLQLAWPTAIRQRERTKTGNEIYLAPDLGLDGCGLDLIVARDGPGRGRQCLVTVLPVGTGRQYRHERREARTSLADPSTEALRIAVTYVVDRADVDPAARVARDRIAAIAPWAVRPSMVSPEPGSGREVDRCEDVAVVAEHKD